MIFDEGYGSITPEGTHTIRPDLVARALLATAWDANAPDMATKFRIPSRPTPPDVQKEIIQAAQAKRARRAAKHKETRP